MEVIYLGGDSFLLKGERVVAINPPRGQKSDITLFSTRQRSSKLTVNGPGEYEIGGVLMVTTELPGAPNLIQSVCLDDLNIVHLGAQAAPLPPDALRSVGRVDVLLVDADRPEIAAAAVRELTPRVVIPYGSRASEFCQSLNGQKERSTRFAWNGLTRAPRALVLKPDTNRAEAA